MDRTRDCDFSACLFHCTSRQIRYCVVDWTGCVSSPCNSMFWWHTLIPIPPSQHGILLVALSLTFWYLCMIEKFCHACNQWSYHQSLCVAVSRNPYYYSFLKVAACAGLSDHPKWRRMHTWRHHASHCWCVWAPPYLIVEPKNKNSSSHIVPSLRVALWHRAQNACSRVPSVKDSWEPCINSVFYPFAI